MVRIQFQLTPNTEAPAEMNIYLPDLQALRLAENANGSMHNILAPRGALVRDAKAWADDLTEPIRLYGDKTQVLFTSHFWPHWGGFNRGYYGTMSHNSKAVYQRHLGWYDGNPANLAPLPPEDAGRRYVAAMGGPDKVVALGRATFVGIIAGKDNGADASPEAAQLRAFARLSEPPRSAFGLVLPGP